MNAVIGFSFNLLSMQGLVGITSQNNKQGSLGFMDRPEACPDC